MPDYGVDKPAPTDSQYVLLATDTTLVNERTLAAGTGIKLTDGGAGSSITVSHSPVEQAKKWIVFQTDFIHPNEGNNMIPFDDTVSGTNAAVSSQATTSATEVGIITLTTGTTATGRAAITPGTTGLNTIILGGGEITVLCKLKLTDLSAVAQEYILRVGLIDSVSTTSTNGVYFVYDRSNNTNWGFIARAGGAGSTTFSASSVDTNWNWLKIVINAAGTSASFYLNGSLLTTNNTISSGLPTSATSFGLSLVKTNGTTARVLTVDFFGIYQELTTARTF